jgi:hypothetical protein
VTERYAELTGSFGLVQLFRRNGTCYRKTKRTGTVLGPPTNVVAERFG